MRPTCGDALEGKQRLKINPAIGRPGGEWSACQAVRLAESGGRQIADGQTRIPGVEYVARHDRERQVVAARCVGWTKNSAHAAWTAETASWRPAVTTTTSASASGALIRRGSRFLRIRTEAKRLGETDIDGHVSRPFAVIDGNDPLARATG